MKSAVIALALSLFATVLSTTAMLAADKDEQRRQDQRREVLSRLGIKQAYYIATPVPTPAPRGTDKVEAPDFFPGKPPESSPPPVGWMLSLGIGILQEAGFSTGDVVTKINDVDFLRSEDDLAETIAASLAKKGCCTLTVRRFDKSYWSDGKAKADSFTNREVIILAWK